MWAILQRELRTQAREPATYRFRLLCAVLVVGFLGAGLLVRITAWGPTGPVTRGLRGPEIFRWLGQVLFFLTALITPALTADTLSRERREGTLPLLFLTPLTPSGVVFGKLAAHLVRALSVALAAVPMLAVPLLLGGVDAGQLAGTVLILIAASLTGLAGGLWASARSDSLNRSLALGFAFVAGSFFAGICLYLVVFRDWSVLGNWMFSPGRWISRSLQVLDIVTAGAGSNTLTFQDTSWMTPASMWATRRLGVGPVAGRFPALGTSASTGWVGSLAALVGALGLLAAVVAFAARRVRAHAQLQPPTTAELERRERWTRPRFFPEWFRGAQRRNLARNPLLWLQRRTPAQSLARWGWLGLAAIAWTNLVTGFGWIGNDDGAILMLALPLVLTSAMVLWVAGALRIERQNGTLELLLVTGLTEDQLLRAAVRATFSTFLPAVILHVAVSSFLASFRNVPESLPSLAFPLATSVLTFPVIGLFFALREDHYLAAAGKTALAGVVVPMIGGTLITWFLVWGEDPAHTSFVNHIANGTALVQLALLPLAWWRVRAALRSRSFVVRTAAAGA